MSDIRFEKETLSALVPKQAVLDFKPSVTAKEVHAALDRFLELAGCPNCGFNGIDIRFGARFDFRQAFQIENLIDARITDRRW